MSDETTNTEDLAEQAPADELTVLKNRARLMGITYSPNIGVAALKAKIDAKLAETDEGSNIDPEAPNPLETDPPAPPKEETVQEIRARLRRDEMRLIRCRITNLDPKKKDLPGEIYTIANEYLGTVRKFIPFGEQTDEGYHIPFCLFKMLRDRKFLHIRTIKGPNGTPAVKHEYVREFAIEELPPLTQAELDKLAATQAAAGLFSSND